VAEDDHAAVFFAQMLAHVFAFEPGFHIATGFISAAFIGAAMQDPQPPRLVWSALDFYGLMEGSSFLVDALYLPNVAPVWRAPRLGVGNAGRR
jgi:hypothetical protein